MFSIALAPFPGFGNNFFLRPLCPMCYNNACPLCQDLRIGERTGEYNYNITKNSNNLLHFESNAHNKGERTSEICLS